MSDVVTKTQLQAFAKKLRLKSYYAGAAVGHDESDRDGIIRSGRTQALDDVADTFDEVFEFDSILTQQDLRNWRG